METLALILTPLLGVILASLLIQLRVVSNFLEKITPKRLSNFGLGVAACLYALLPILILSQVGTQWEVRFFRSGSYRLTSGLALGFFLGFSMMAAGHLKKQRPKS